MKKSVTWRYLLVVGEFVYESVALRELAADLDTHNGILTALEIETTYTESTKKTLIAHVKIEA